jgi:predicted PurR-regulated permease PerM
MNSFISEAGKIINIIKEKGIFPESFISELNEFLNTNFTTRVDLTSPVNSLITWILSLSQKVVLSLPNTILNIFIMFFFIYYLFKEGNNFVKILKKYLPFSKNHKTLLIDKVEKTTKAVLYGHIVTAIVQGVVAGIGYILFGINAPVFFGLVTMFFALFPVAGPPLVYVPISFFQIILNLQSKNYIGLAKGIGLLFYGIGVISTVDNIIKPHIISQQAEIHPLIIIIGVFGGLSVFGVIGFILGPLIFSIFLSILNVFKIE